MGFDPQMPPAQGQKIPSAEELHRKMLLNNQQSDSSIAKGLGGGLLAAVVGSLVWMAITYFTNFQIGWMAVGVGFLVGVAVRWFGRGNGIEYGLVGAVLSLFGCLLGNLLTACVAIAVQESVGIGQVLGSLTADLIVEIFTVTFHPMDLLFYGLAVYWGYKYSLAVPASSQAQSTAGSTPSASN